MKQIILAIAFVTINAQLAKAETTSEGKILEIRTTHNEIYVVQENATYPGGCKNAKNLVAYVYNGDKHFSLLQPLIAAYQSEESVSLKLECKTDNIAEIREVLLHKLTK